MGPCTEGEAAEEHCLDGRGQRLQHWREHTDHSLAALGKAEKRIGELRALGDRDWRMGGGECLDQEKAREGSSSQRPRPSPRARAVEKRRRWGSRTCCPSAIASETVWQWVQREMRTSYLGHVVSSVVVWDSRRLPCGSYSKKKGDLCMEVQRSRACRESVRTQCNCRDPGSRGGA